MPVASVREDDDTSTARAINFLLARGVDVRRPEGNHHHLKVSADVSYYPTTGRIVEDGHRALIKRGTQTLLAFLQWKKARGFGTYAAEASPEEITLALS